MPLDQDRNRVGGPVFRRCHDPIVIEQILRSDAFDAPIPYFPRSFLRRSVRDLLAPSRDVYFVIAELHGEYAGFTLGHTLGPTLWRKFARAQLARHPFAIGWIVFRLKALRPLQWKLGGWLRRTRSLAADVSPNLTGILTVPKIDRPFAWSAERPDIGQVDQLFVRSRFRGLGLAPQLLRHLTAEMARQKVTLIEAHVDADNYSSLRAFLKAGYEAFQATGGDFYVCHRPLGESRT